MTARSALVALALMLAACAHTVVAVDDGLDFGQRQTELGNISAWDVSGRIAVDTGERGYQARFFWQQRGERLELLVRGLLGARSFRVAGTDSSLTVESRGETETLSDPERQLSEMLGWWLPVTSVEHWLLGRPDPDFAEQSVRGAGDTLARLDQREWQIHYDEYQIAEGRLVPRRITLTDAPLELRLAITDWRSESTSP
ncbi:MAG: lipoprotein insertase outer membrane protein LolB [Gammaproteobacteria bacterium]|jgi:outer membrane lipoprotein LolB